MPDDPQIRSAAEMSRPDQRELLGAVHRGLLAIPVEPVRPVRPITVPERRSPGLAARHRAG